jgi:hypothetical protein
VETRRNLPDIDRLSVITAMILFAYSLTAVINFPSRSIELQLPGFFFQFDLNFMTIVSVVVAVLAAAGCDWLISDHPFLVNQPRWQHWLLPAVTAMVISVPLDILRVSPAWWVVFGLGGILLVIVLLSEYISVDTADSRSALALVSLTAVSLALFLTLAIAMRGAGLRLYLILAALAPACGLVSARALHLRLGGNWKITWAAGISLVMSEIVVGLYYLPVKPVQFGLITTGLLYGLISLAANIEESRSSRVLWIEPLAIILTLVVAGFWFG